MPATRWTIQRGPGGRLHWAADPAFLAWMREHAHDMSNPELAQAITQHTGVALTTSRAKELRKRFGGPVSPEAVRRGYRERLSDTPTVEVFQRQALGPDDTENFVTVTGNVAVTSDWHIPHHDLDMVERLIAVCRRMRVDQLVINGDFLNEDAFSRWPHHRFNVAWPIEKQIARGVLARLLKAFKLVVWTLDNHDRRILAAQERQYQGRGLDESDIVALIAQGVNNGRLRASVDYHYVIVQSGSETWRVTSPKEYRRTKLSLANRLAQLNHQHVIVGGDHLSGVGLDDSGRYVIASNLSMVDQARTPYVNVQDTTFPKWQRGFHLILNGVLHTLCHHPALIDWDYWTRRAVPPTGASTG